MSEDSAADQGQGTHRLSRRSSDPQVIYARYCWELNGEEGRIENTKLVLQSNWQKPALKKFARKLGLRVSGTKSEIAERLAKDGVFNGHREQRLYYVQDSGVAVALSEVQQSAGPDDGGSYQCFYAQCDREFDSLDDMVAVDGQGQRSPRHFCEPCAERILRGPPMTDGGQPAKDGREGPQSRETDVREYGDRLAGTQAIIEGNADELGARRPHPDAHLYDVEESLRHHAKEIDEFLRGAYYL